MPIRVDFDMLVKVPFNSTFYFWAPETWMDYLLNPRDTTVDVDTQHAVEFIQRTTKGKFPDIAFGSHEVLRRKSGVGFTDEICCLYFGGIEWKDTIVKPTGGEVVMHLTPRNFGLDFDDWTKL